MVATTEDCLIEVTPPPWVREYSKLLLRLLAGNPSFEVKYQRLLLDIVAQTEISI
jgi:hypothetical protein